MTADELNNPCDSAADSRHYNETALIERYSNWQAHATAG
jgi:hypothetical protein